MCLGRGLGEDLTFPDLLRSVLLLERGVLEVRPREALPDWCQLIGRKTDFIKLTDCQYAPKQRVSMNQNR